MSIADLAMLVNDNFSVPLNQQIRSGKYLASEIITTSKTYTFKKKGWYKVICVGAGGNAHTRFTANDNYGHIYTGGAGGVAIKDIYATSNMQADIVINDERVTFLGNIIANNGEDADWYSGEGTPGMGGTASGGTFNYDGEDGIGVAKKTSFDVKGASVGVFIPELSRYFSNTISGMADTTSATIQYDSGYGLCGYGQSDGGGVIILGNGSNEQFLSQPTNKTGAVIIIPLEFEEE